MIAIVLTEGIWTKHICSRYHCSDEVEDQQFRLTSEELWMHKCYLPVQVGKVNDGWHQQWKRYESDSTCNKMGRILMGNVSKINLANMTGTYCVYWWEISGKLILQIWQRYFWAC